MENLKGAIWGMPVEIVGSKMTSQKCDAYIVPQFPLKNEISSGLGDDILQAGAEQGMRAYGEHLEKQRKGLELGNVFVARSGGGNSKYLIHAAILGSGKSNEFFAIQKSVYNALTEAQKNNIKTIAIPALGTDKNSTLKPIESAFAIMDAIYEFARQGQSIREAYNSGIKRTTLHQITLTVPKNAIANFATILNDKWYEADSFGKEERAEFKKWVEQERSKAAAVSRLR